MNKLHLVDSQDNTGYISDVYNNLLLQLLLIIIIQSLAFTEADCVMPLKQNKQIKNNKENNKETSLGNQRV